MTTTVKPPILFWIIAIIGLLWNIMGVMNYLQQAYSSESFKAQVTTEQLAVLESRPTWATAVFAIAVFSGVIGCLLLLFRKKMAVSLLTISFLGALATQIWWFTTTGPSISDQFSGTIMPIIIVGFCLFLMWYSKSASKKNWIN